MNFNIEGNIMNSLKFAFGVVGVALVHEIYIQSELKRLEIKSQKIQELLDNRESKDLWRYREFGTNRFYCGGEEYITMPKAETKLNMVNDKIKNMEPFSLIYQFNQNCRS